MNTEEEFGLAEKFYRVRQTMLLLSEKTELPNSELCLMSIIAKNSSPEGISVSEIAARLKVTPPAVSRSLKSLEERGLIERRVNSTNRRSTMVSLTDKGMKLLHRAGEKFAGMMKYVGSEIGEERLEEFSLLFRDVLKSMSDYINKKEECSDDQNA